MQINISYERPAEGPGSGPVKIGWLLTENDSGIVFSPPERVRSAEMSKSHAKSASRCPAVIAMEARYFAIKCPFDLHLRFVRDKDGRPLLKNLLGEKSPVRGNKLKKHLHVVEESEWRYAKRPTIQLSLPYILVADEPVYMTQLAPFMHYRREPLPGTIFGGRFPINLWPRPLMWAFEWHDIETDLKLTRGEPLFYCLFETEPQDRAIQVFEAERTPQLTEYLELIGGAVNYVNQTFALFKEAEARRPTTLLQAKTRD